MAFLPGDDKQEDPNQQPGQDQSNQVPNIAGSAGFSGPQSNVVGSSGGGVSTAGVGKGGTGGWTNIQAYIDANKNYNSGAEQGIRDKVGSQFDQDKNRLQTESSQVRNSLQEQQNKANEARQNYGQWIDQGAKNYTYDLERGASIDGQQSPVAQKQTAYKDYFGKLQNALNMKYQGPDSVSYQRSADTQRYGDALGNDQAYRNLLSEYYRDKGGGQLSSGQRNLQDQLDLNNTGLNQARQDLTARYQDLGNLENQELGQTNQLINATKEQLGNLNLRNLLQNDADRINQSIGEQEAAAKAAYDQAYRGQSGRATGGYGIYNDMINSDGSTQQAIGRGQINKRIGQGIWGDNITYEQLQKEADLYKDNRERFGGSPVGQEQVNNYNALLNWYNQQDEKYGNTADMDERKWNMIADLLGTSAPRKEQGFKVR